MAWGRFGNVDQFPSVDFICRFLTLVFESASLQPFVALQLQEFQVSDDNFAPALDQAIQLNGLLFRLIEETRRETIEVSNGCEGSRVFLDQSM